ncbi:hypothetical protein FKX85_11400 [Echinicola soli]|uniref:Uncharacterized protein n=1 Tax=Echinicola soli TaxID=2591634 RepID=A0A514CIL1_9BACT|nr:hypothetical protein [Echinicola soli]QDH79610.1 hypothetical protein FKX85_11400 [Echinicola soli]
MKKQFFTLSLCLLVYTAFGQVDAPQKKITNLEPDVWLGIWDEAHSGGQFTIDTISYDEIPKYLDFRGTVVEALQWNDEKNEHILIQSVTGHFNWKEYYDEDSTDYMIQDKSELYAYHFQKQKDEQHFTKVWRMYDYNECYGVDWFTGFIPGATTITDVDKDGISEISIPYVIICRGGMDPGIMNIIMYEGDTQYALAGETMFCRGEQSYGGTYTQSDNLDKNPKLLHFLMARWDAHKCEDDRLY